jgi:hypothetical protein
MRVKQQNGLFLEMFSINKPVIKIFHHMILFHGAVPLGAMVSLHDTLVLAENDN